MKSENFRSSKKHLKSLEICLGTLISHFGIIKNPEYSKQTSKNKENTKRSPNCCPLLDPYDRGSVGAL